MADNNEDKQIDIAKNFLTSISPDKAPDKTPKEIQKKLIGEDQVKVTVAVNLVNKGVARKETSVKDIIGKSEQLTKTAEASTSPIISAIASFKSFLSTQEQERVRREDDKHTEIMESREKTLRILSEKIGDINDEESGGLLTGLGGLLAKIASVLGLSKLAGGMGLPGFSGKEGKDGKVKGSSTQPRSGSGLGAAAAGAAGAAGASGASGKDSDKRDADKKQTGNKPDSKTKSARGKFSPLSSAAAMLGAGSLFGKKDKSELDSIKKSSRKGILGALKGAAGFIVKGIIAMIGGWPLAIAAALAGIWIFVLPESVKKDIKDMLSSILGDLPEGLQEVFVSLGTIFGSVIKAFDYVINFSIKDYEELPEKFEEFMNFLNTIPGFFNYLVDLGKKKLNETYAEVLEFFGIRTKNDAQGRAIPIGDALSTNREPVQAGAKKSAEVVQREKRQQAAKESFKQVDGKQVYTDPNTGNVITGSLTDEYFKVVSSTGEVLIKPSDSMARRQELLTNINNSTKFSENNITNTASKSKAGDVLNKTQETTSSATSLTNELNITDTANNIFKEKFIEKIEASTREKSLVENNFVTKEVEPIVLQTTQSRKAVSETGIAPIAKVITDFSKRVKSEKSIIEVSKPVKETVQSQNLNAPASSPDRPSLRDVPMVVDDLGLVLINSGGLD